MKARAKAEAPGSKKEMVSFRVSSIKEPEMDMAISFTGSLELFLNLNDITSRGLSLEPENIPVEKARSNSREANACD